MGAVLASFGGRGPFQIVIHRQKSLDGVALGILVDIVLFLGCTLAVVVILGGEAGELILHGFQLLGSQFHLFHLLPGKGDALFLFLFLLGLLLRLLILGGLLLLRLRCLGSLGRLLYRLFGFFAHVSVSSFGGNSCFSCLPKSFVSPSAKPVSLAATAA